MLLELSTSMLCPMQCSYCPQDLAGREYQGPRLMSLDTFAKAMRHLPEGIPLSFAGLSEPFINKATSAMIVAGAAKGRQIQIYTTGVGLRDADVAIILSVLDTGKLYRLVLHLPDAEGDMKASVTSDYIKRVRTLLKLVPFAKAVCFGTLHPFLIEFEPWLRKDRVISRAGNVVHLTTPAQIGGHLKCGPAPDLKNNVMLPNGDLIVCCQDYGLRHVIGNLVEQSWDEIHAGERMQQFKQLMKSSTKEQCLCRTCEYAVPSGS